MGYFNPRSHERSDCALLYLSPTRCDFNPRSHERSDWYFELRSVNLSISIHAPTRGATVWAIISWFWFYISIHAPTRGATICSRLVVTRLLISIHAPTRGATWVIFDSFKHFKFQSTLPREERLIFWAAFCQSFYFNPRSHERSDPLPGIHTLLPCISIHAPTRGATS